MNDEVLAQKFETQMFEAYRRAKTEAKYNATVFYNMLNTRGAVSTAKFLVNADKQSDGFTALFESERLDLTVEAIIVENPRWHPLFLPEEIAKARLRLQKNGYKLGGQEPAR